LIAFLLLAAGTVAAETALDRYLRKPDASYQWTRTGSLPCGGCEAHLLDLKSQTWRKQDEVDRTVWQHWLTVIRPEKTTSGIGLLFINGGNNTGKPPARADAILSSIAKEAGVVVADLRMVPNEPLQFAGEAKTRTEDGIIAYTWDKFLRGGDEEWPLRLPMTKAAVRAMDAVQAFSQTPEGGGIQVERFIVSGGSKRGWTAWTTAATDRRVIAAAPLVIDMLNLEKSFTHHWRVYGFWAPAVRDYTAMRIMDWMGTRRYQELLRIEEPFEYRSRLKMPKFIVNSTGDQFFVPDSSQFYINELPGETYLRYVPNTDHSLRNSDALPALVAWAQSIVHNRPRPRFSWKIEKDGKIRVRTVDPPQEVRLWQATNPKARDFRVETIGRAYQSVVLEASKPGVYIGEVTKPAAGFTAYFVELIYPGSGSYSLKFTTGVKVTPDTYPYPPPKLNSPVP
jgi:PhoPQ-activated pathogenicity-related protein